MNNPRFKATTEIEQLPQQVFLNLGVGADWIRAIQNFFRIAFFIFCSEFFKTVLGFINWHI